VSDNNVGTKTDTVDFTTKADEIAKNQYVNRKLAGTLKTVNLLVDRECLIIKKTL
jgi:hypothetical protein